MSELRASSAADPVSADDLAGCRFALVVSRTNAEITERLLEGARRTLAELGVGEEQLLVVDVPGAYELPMAAARAASAGGWDAVVCLGALIRGGTYHFEVLCHAVAGAIQQVAHDASVPVTFGVITCDDRRQALARAGGEVGNKGAEAALAAAEMVRAFARIDASGAG